MSAVTLYECLFQVLLFLFRNVLLALTEGNIYWSILGTMLHLASYAQDLFNLPEAV